MRLLQCKEPKDLEKVDSRLKREIGNCFLDHNLHCKRQQANNFSLKCVGNAVVVPRRIVKRMLHLMHSSLLFSPGAAKRTLFCTKRLLETLGWVLTRMLGIMFLLALSVKSSNEGPLGRYPIP